MKFWHDRVDRVEPHRLARRPLSRHLPAVCQLADTPAHRLHSAFSQPQNFFRLPPRLLIINDPSDPHDSEFNDASPAENSKWLPPRQVRHPEIDFFRSLEMMLPALPP